MKKLPFYLFSLCTCLNILILCPVSTASSITINTVCADMISQETRNWNKGYVKSDDGILVSIIIPAILESADFINEATSGEYHEWASDDPQPGHIVLISSGFSDLVGFNELARLYNDGFPFKSIPEPASILLLGIGMVGLAEFSRIYSKQRTNDKDMP